MTMEYRQERARMEIPGGRSPRFTEPLPKVVELDEGDMLYLDCTVEGYPRPKGKFIGFFPKYF